MDHFFLNLVGRMPFFFPSAWAGTSNSCTADKENPRKNKHETMYVPHSARRPGGIDLPTSRLLVGALPTELLVPWYWSLPTFYLTYWHIFSVAARQHKSLLHVLARVVSARAASVLDGCSVLDSLLAELSLEALFPHHSKLGYNLRICKTLNM